jgi:hypothetical protein
MRCRLVVVLALLGALASGCIPSKSPLSDPEKAKPDERLIGMWISSDEKAEGTDFCFVSKPKRVAGVPPGILMWTNPAPKKGEPAHFLFFSTVIGDSSYFNVILLREEAHIALQANRWAWNRGAIVWFGILKYDIKDNQCVVSHANMDLFNKAIAAGEIKGKKDHNLPSLTDTTANVSGFIADSKETLFKASVTYTIVN